MEGGSEASEAGAEGPGEVGRETARGNPGPGGRSGRKAGGPAEGLQALPGVSDTEKRTLRGPRLAFPDGKCWHGMQTSWHEQTGHLKKQETLMALDLSIMMGCKLTKE